MTRLAPSPRLPRSGNAALAAGACIQAVLGLEFVLAGLSKAIDPDFTTQFTQFVSGSGAAKNGPLAGLIQAVLLPNADLLAQVAKFTELAAGAILLLAALEVLRRRLSDPIGAPHPYEPLVALASSLAAFVLAGMSLTIYVLEGGQVPSVSASFALASPITIELFLVPLALALALLELGRYRALRPH